MKNLYFLLNLVLRSLSLSLSLSLFLPLYGEISLSLFITFFLTLYISLSLRDLFSRSLGICLQLSHVFKKFLINDFALLRIIPFLIRWKIFSLPLSLSSLINKLFRKNLNWKVTNWWFLICLAEDYNDGHNGISGGQSYKTYHLRFLFMSTEVFKPCFEPSKVFRRGITRSLTSLGRLSLYRQTSCLTCLPLAAFCVINKVLHSKCFLFKQIWVIVWLNPNQ